MKLCSLCRIDKPIDAFNRNRHKKDGLQTLCRECSHRRFAAYYKTNRVAHRKTVRARTTKIKYTNRAWLWDYLNKHPCLDCGEADPVVLEFDHVKDSKRSSISKLMAWGCGLEVIQSEIEKCEVRCANCHRRVTYKRAGSWRHAKSGSLV